MSLDKNQLKVQALLEKVSSLTMNYENQLADARVELTIVSQERDELLRRLEEVAQDVAQDEDLTGLLTQDGGLGDTRVAAADPQDVGRLALGAVLEELGVFGGDVLGPNLVGLERGGESVVWRSGGVSWVFVARGLSSRRWA